MEVKSLLLLHLYCQKKLITMFLGEILILSFKKTFARVNNFNFIIEDGIFIDFIDLLDLNCICHRNQVTS